MKENQSVKVQALPQLLMRNPDLSALPPLALPEGFSVHTHRAGDDAVWEQIVSDAFGMQIPISRLKNYEVYSPEYVWYVEKDGVPIGTADAVERAIYPGEGWLRMVAVLKNARGLGAGRIVVSAALQSLRARGYTSALLTTDDERIPAIKLYLSLGFRPVLAHKSHEARWEKIFRALEQK